MTSRWGRSLEQQRVVGTGHGANHLIPGKPERRFVVYINAQTGWNTPALPCVRTEVPVSRHAGAHHEPSGWRAGKLTRGCLAVSFVRTARMGIG